MNTHIMNQTKKNGDAKYIYIFVYIDEKYHCMKLLNISLYEIYKNI